jgi:hypothetical protein
MNDGGDPCVCGDKTTWHPECYRDKSMRKNQALAIGCPFCRKLPDIEEEKTSKGTRFKVQCLFDWCKVHPFVIGTSRGKAISKWNTRKWLEVETISLRQKRTKPRKIDERETYSITSTRAAIKKATE